MKHIIEGLLFLSGDEGLSEQQLLDTLEISKVQLHEEIEVLRNIFLCEDHGIELIHFGGIYKFVSKQQVYAYAEKLFSNTKMANLSSAALETLAIVAYKQPITRVEIEEIRGVGADMMIKKLMARSLLKEAGRSDAPGRPFLYEVTTEFMDSFKLESLKELPELDEYEVQVQEELFNEQ
ncbi:MAG: SMC-Scp complex subunit ScpB [Breznakia sp.]